MRAGFAQFKAFSQDAKDNKIFEQTKLTMPVLAVGGETSFGPLHAVIMRYVATNVQEAVVAGSGHWLMEERPAEAVALLRSFLDAASSAGGSGEERWFPAEYKFPGQGNPGTVIRISRVCTPSCSECLLILGSPRTLAAMTA